MGEEAGQLLRDPSGEVLEHAAARDSYRLAARRTTSIPEQRYLESRAARLTIDER